MTATNPAVSSAVSLDDMRSRTVVTRCYPSRDPAERECGHKDLTWAPTAS